MEIYSGSVRIEFEDIPNIRLQTIRSRAQAGVLERLAVATKRRKFSLRENWKFKITGVKHADDLNGVIEVPYKDEAGNKLLFDGASIPLPWLVSLLTIGILRPLGVMLIGSIVHDYAYRYGNLLVSKEGKTFLEVPIERDVADKLLRDIIGTVNGMPMVAYIGWFFVRIGWLWVPYNKQRFGGAAPVAELSLLTVVVLLLLFACHTFGVQFLIGCFILLYLIVYAATVLINRVSSKHRKGNL